VLEPRTEDDDIRVEGAAVAELKASGRVARQYCVAFDFDLR
jgi:hypothetical protein